MTRLAPRLLPALSALILAATSACSDQKAGNLPAQSPLPGSSAESTGSSEPLPPEKAFSLRVEAVDSRTLLAAFTPAPDHYLYKGKIVFALKTSNGAQLQTVSFPAGTLKKDPFFGDIEVYSRPVQISLPLTRVGKAPAQFTLVATYQGCNEKIGLCYSPIESRFDFELP